MQILEAGGISSRDSVLTDLRILGRKVAPRTPRMIASVPVRDRRGIDRDGVIELVRPPTRV